MSVYPDIPIEQQMLAFVDKTTRQELIASHNLDSLAFALPQKMDFTRSQLIAFLRTHPEHVDQYVSVNPPVQVMHDVPVLERRRRYHVYWIDHGTKRNEQEFEDLYEALNAYFVGFVSEPEEDERLRQEHLTRIARANTIDEIMDA